MPSKIINSYYASGYSLKATYNQLTIVAGGGIGGTGLLAGSYSQILNDGTVHATGASYGMYLQSGGFIQNGDITNAGASATVALTRPGC